VTCCNSRAQFEAFFQPRIKPGIKKYDLDDDEDEEVQKEDDNLDGEGEYPDDG